MLNNVLDMTGTNWADLKLNKFNNPELQTMVAKYNKQNVYSSVVMSREQVQRFRSDMGQGGSRDPVNGIPADVYYVDPAFKSEDQEVDYDLLSGGSKYGLDKTHMIKRAWFSNKLAGGFNPADRVTNVVFFDSKINSGDYSKYIETGFEDFVDKHGIAKLTVIPTQFKPIKLRKDNKDGTVQDYNTESANAVFYNMSNGKGVSQWHKLQNQGNGEAIITDVREEDVIANVFESRGIALDTQRLVYGAYALGNKGVTNEAIANSLKNMPQEEKDMMLLFTRYAGKTKEAIDQTKDWNIKKEGLN